MNELKASPGPWELIEVPRGFIVTADERSYDIATVRNVGNHDNKANAALIAAAPELYAALEERVALVSRLNHERNLFLSGERDARTFAAVVERVMDYPLELDEEAYAALKKARGE